MTVEDAFGPLLERRACGPCTACCTVPRIDELEKPADTTCAHCIAEGCSIYDARPGACRAFFCGWRRLADLPESARPDRSGMIVMLEVAPGAPNPFERRCIVVRGIDRAPRLDTPIGKRLLALSRRARIPLFVSAPGTTRKQLANPDLAIYRPIVRGERPSGAAAAEVARWRASLMPEAEPTGRRFA